MTDKYRDDMMARRPADIPERVWALSFVPVEEGREEDAAEFVARAIMAEMARCDLVVTEEWHRHVSTGASAEKMVARILNRIRGVD